MGYFLVIHVLIPKGAYRGQKLTIPVRVKTTASVISTIPHVPLTVSVKKSVAKTAASNNRMMRSADPIFAFIVEIIL
jgi:hypothetical protein